MASLVATREDIELGMTLACPVMNTSAVVCGCASTMKTSFQRLPDTN